MKRAKGTFNMLNHIYTSSHIHFYLSFFYILNISTSCDYCTYVLKADKEGCLRFIHEPGSAAHNPDPKDDNRAHYETSAREQLHTKVGIRVTENGAANWRTNQ